MSSVDGLVGPMSELSLKRDADAADMMQADDLRALTWRPKPGAKPTDAPVASSHKLTEPAASSHDARCAPSCAQPTRKELRNAAIAALEAGPPQGRGTDEPKKKLKKPRTRAAWQWYNRYNLLGRIPEDPRDSDSESTHECYPLSSNA